MSNSALITNRTAWTAAGMLLAQASIGVLRLNRRSSRAFHVALGAVLLPVVLMHAWFSMSVIPRESANSTGLWIATAALLLAVQSALGMKLIRPSPETDGLRIFHLIAGFAIVVFAGLHVLLIK